MWDAGDVGMFGMWNVGDVRYSGCGMFEMRNVRGVRCSRCGMFGMWDVWDVECWGCGMFGMWDVQDVRCWRCGMWDVGCLPGCGMLIYNALKLKQNLRKNKVVDGKTPFFVVGPFCTHHSRQFCME